MEHKINNKGFNFYMIDVNSWLFDDHSGVIFDGKFASVVIHALRPGFIMADIEKGVEMMLYANNDSIHFGAFRSEIYTFNRKDKKRVA